MTKYEYLFELLHFAIANGNIGQFQNSLNIENQITVGSKEGKTKLQEAVHEKDERECTLLHYVARAINPVEAAEAIDKLIANGAEINALDEWGKTPLHYAQQPEVALKLIADGANINAQDNGQSTP